MSEFRNADIRPQRMVPWIAGIATAVAAIIHLALTGELNLHLVAATPLGVFFSVLLGCGLCALFFSSDESGHDRSVADATRKSRGNDTARG